jgi:ArsR family transcriptional regulator
LENLAIGQSALSYHMRILLEAGIVEGRQEGKWTHYRICEQGSRKAIDLLSDLTKINPET